MMTWLPESFWSLYSVLCVFKVKFEFRYAQGKAKSMFNLQALFHFAIQTPLFNLF